MDEKNKFEVIIIGIILDPSTKRILIGKHDQDPEMPQLTWCFPGGHATHGEDVDTILKKNIKAKTGYDIKNLGAIFSKTYLEKENLLAVYFLTQVFEGEEKPGENFSELKWISPHDLEKYFTTSFHPKLKEYLIDLI